MELTQTGISPPELPLIVGSSPPIQETIARVRRVAPYFRTALVTGETGTGKELIARTLHELSPASGGPYVAVNCAAVTETLLESELFGHVKGAFTGAVSDKAGLIESANRGTLLLDEIGDMPLPAQAKLLRVLQTQEVQRVGALTTRRVEVKVVAATNHDLRSLIAQKRFREDLFYRIGVVEIPVPALRDRIDDLPLLEDFFIRRYVAEFRKPIMRIGRRAEMRLAQHTWPGNVRELENVIGHACMMASSETIGLDDLPDYLRKVPAEPETRTTLIWGSALSLDEQERALVADALEKCRGNKSAAARRLKIGRDAVRYKAKKYALDKRRDETSLAIAC